VSAGAAPVGPAAEAVAAGGAARELSDGEDAAEEDASICDVGGSGLVLPVLPDENTWDKPARAMLYFAGLSWCFVGVSIVANIFMAAIEAITGKRKTLKLSNGRTVVVKVWNDTVANLSLMALGSSAPEILLSVLEIVGNDFYSGALGPSTIVGSAAFNLLVIIAVCMYGIPNGESRTIKRPAVFIVTAVASTFAYLWLVIIVGVSTPEVIEPWEGVSTFVFFPVLLAVAFAADKGWLSPRAAKQGHALSIKRSCTNLHCDITALPDHEVKLVEDSALAGRTRAQVRKGVGMIGENKKDVPATDLTVGFTTHEFSFPADAGEIILEVEKTGQQVGKYFVRVYWEDSKGRKGHCLIHKYESRGSVTLARSSKTAGERLTVSLTRAVASHTEAALSEGDETTQYCTRRKACAIAPGLAKAEVCIAGAETQKAGTGKLKLAEDVIDHQPSTECETTCWVKVQRFDGSEGPVECRLLTVADSARPLDGLADGAGDYMHKDDVLVLEDGVIEKSVEIKIQKRSPYEGSDRLYVELEGDHVAEGKDSRCAINILPASGDADTAMRVARWMDHAFNFDVMSEGTTRWGDQFRNAIWPVPVEDHDEVSAAEWCMHFVALPWKLLFALIPPVSYGGGWVCFCVALVFIGGVTAVIGDLASLMGCCMGLPDSITAITIVALGTSLPDLFASKVSAVEDPSADNAIGNVTGSNAVNVFLGLGLPWMMAAFYWDGSATAKWRLKYPEQAELFPSGAFVVLAGDLVFSVLVFLMCTVVAFAVVYYRRKAHGAELGGPTGIKINSAILFVVLWMVYVSCASWKTLAGDVGADAMVLAVLCNVAGAGFLMVLIVGGVHYYEAYQKRSEEFHQGEQMSLVKTVVQAVRQESARRTLITSIGSAKGAKGGGGIAAAAKKMEEHLTALTAICQELQQHGKLPDEDDAEEGRAQPGAAEAADGRRRKKVRRGRGEGGDADAATERRNSLMTE